MFKKRGVVLLVLLLIAGCVAWFVAGRALKARGYSGTGEMLSQTFSNYPRSFDAEPFKLSITVDPIDFDKLSDVVDKARDRGVILPEGNDYVPAQLKSDDGEFNAKIRIKGKLTDHVKGDKWSFRIISRKGGGFSGMQRFSIQHPGTRNYLYEWFYHRMMKREGVIALRYGFVDVELNQKALGLYAYEEHFGQELLANNNRVPGPIFRFDPSLYWIHRLNEMNHVRFREAFADHHAAMLDTYDSGNVFKSEQRTEDFKQALIRMNAVRSGLLSASDVFDTDKVALRHAVIDLIGGHHSMDWSDIKFYYNPLAKIIEPVSYESFSVRPLEQLAGAFRYVGKAKSRKEIHDIFFNDEKLFRQYVAHLERIASNEYLDALFLELGADLDSVSSIVFKEFPWKPLNRELYYKNAEVIRASLNIPNGVHAFISKNEKGGSQLQLVPIAELPIEIHELRFGEHVIPIDSTIILPSRKDGQLGKAMVLNVNVADSMLKDYKNLHVSWSVLGSAKKKQTGVIPMEYPSEEELEVAVVNEAAEGVLAKPMIQLVEDQKELIVLGGEHHITSDLVVPVGYALVFGESCKLLFEGADLIINGSMRSSDGNNQTFVLDFSSESRMHIQNSKSGNDLRNFHLVGSASTETLLTIVQSNIRFVNCSIIGNEEHDLLLLANSRLEANNLRLKNGKDILKSFHSALNGDIVIESAKDDGLSLFGGSFGAKKNSSIRVSACGGVALKLEGAAQVELLKGSVLDAHKGVHVKDGSAILVDELELTRCDLGIVTDKSDILNGESSATIKKLIFNEVDKEFSIGKKSNVRVAGKQIGAKQDSRR